MKYRLNVRIFTPVKKLKTQKLCYDYSLAHHGLRHSASFTIKYEFMRVRSALECFLPMIFGRLCFLFNVVFCDHIPHHLYQIGEETEYYKITRTPFDY